MFISKLPATSSIFWDDIHLKLIQLKNTSDCTDVETEKHASEAGGACHGEGAPSVDLGGIRLHGIVLDDASDDLRTGGNASAHDCGYELVTMGFGVGRGSVDESPWSSVVRRYQRV